MARPFENPESMTQQLLNLSWRLAVEMRALLNTLSTKLGKEEAAETYLGIHAKADSAAEADSVAWDNVTGKPDIGAVASMDKISIADVEGLEQKLTTEDDDYGSISEEAA